MQLTYAIRNIHRAVGTRFSAHLVRGHLNERMAADHVTVQLKGSAGQSLGAFAVRGLKLVVFGDANDYVGKGLSGGTIIVRPPARSPLISNENTIIGNTVLYGATSGQLFASGQAGERFAVRNSGAEAVIEGCGDNGCEYMTGGTCVILGSVGDNFAAGMTGGMAFIYDDRNDFDSHLNQDTVIATRIQSAHWEAHLQNLIERHLTATDSRHAAMLLSNWKESLNRFWQVVPKEMLNRLSHPLSDEKERESA
jgi:glutamate synthase (NADPH/NADH) large chain